MYTSISETTSILLLINFFIFVLNTHFLKIMETSIVDKQENLDLEDKNPSTY